MRKWLPPCAIIKRYTLPPPAVQQRWARFAGGLTPAGCESLVVRAADRKLGTTRFESHAPENATEGWHLATRGYVPYAAAGQRDPAALAAERT